MVLDTARLILRDYTLEDFEALFEILSDAETMQHYPKPYDAEMTKHWIEWNIQNYQKYGFGIWAVILKETGEFIGDCGITMQNIDGKLLPEIGYHIRRDMQNKGYATEAAAGCIRYGFEQLDFDSLYSYMKYTNEASARVAVKNGMKFIRKYADKENTFTNVYCINREDWENERTDKNTS